MRANPLERTHSDAPHSQKVGDTTKATHPRTQSHDRLGSLGPDARQLGQLRGHRSIEVQSERSCQVPLARFRGRSAPRSGAPGPSGLPRGRFARPFAERGSTTGVGRRFRGAPGLGSGARRAARHGGPRQAPRRRGFPNLASRTALPWRQGLAPPGREHGTGRGRHGGSKLRGARLGSNAEACPGGGHQRRRQLRPPVAGHRTEPQPVGARAERSSRPSRFVTEALKRRLPVRRPANAKQAGESDAHTEHPTDGSHDRCSDALSARTGAAGRESVARHGDAESGLGLGSRGIEPRERPRRLPKPGDQPPGRGHPPGGVPPGPPSNRKRTSELRGGQRRRTAHCLCGRHGRGFHIRAGAAAVALRRAVSSRGTYSRICISPVTGMASSFTLTEPSEFVKATPMRFQYFRLLRSVMT